VHRVAECLGENGGSAPPWPAVRGRGDL
jgi:hypothetical protein